ncbi:2-oxoisovalerate dehydrogenase [filamentous cyanobacterium CCT1]|nr:2-oxoisovalerate dehydrogenase [filamentous cyanobacterium CCT1]PSN80908.1 2-oxoisovalerate dehydrogenase [filamentous cyanobacterium CCP4]
MTELIFLVEEDPEGGYNAQALGEPIFTQAEDLVELRTMVRDAVQCHFDENERPRLIRLHIVMEKVSDLASSWI